MVGGCTVSPSAKLHFARLCNGMEWNLLDSPLETTSSSTSYLLPSMSSAVAQLKSSFTVYGVTLPSPLLAVCTSNAWSMASVLFSIGVTAKCGAALLRGDGGRISILGRAKAINQSTEQQTMASNSSKQLSRKPSRLTRCSGDRFTGGDQ